MSVRPTSTGAAYIADFLVEQKVPYVFGPCGHGILGLLDGLFDRQTEIETLSVHHEAVAAFGFGVAGPLGAKLAAPDRPVVTVCGDGGFVMNASAVLAAVEYDLPVVWVVWNNGGFSVIRDQQLGYVGQGRELATMFKGSGGKPFRADYAAMARAMGADGWLVEKPADLAGQREAAIASNRPTVPDVRVDPDIRPLATGSWDLPPLPYPVPNFGWQQD